VKPDSLKPPKEMKVNYSPLRLSALTLWSSAFFSVYSITSLFALASL